jgi:hypothetical protein
MTHLTAPEILRSGTPHSIKVSSESGEYLTIFYYL